MGGEMRILTKDSAGNTNGFLIPIWSELELPNLRPAQVYVTAIEIGMRKGPHLHHIRRGMFTCVQGEVMLRRLLPGSKYHDTFMSPGSGHEIVEPGVPVALYSYGREIALVVNCPYPAWSPEVPDDHPVDKWKDPKGWKT